MRTFVTDGLADGRTDGAGLIRTRIYKYPHQGRQNKWKKNEMDSKSNQTDW